MNSLRRIRDREGRCFELSILPFVRKDPEAAGAMVVHGVLEVELPIAHAWILLADGRIYDPVRDQYFTESEYESKFRAVVERTYTGQEALRMVIVNKDYGPWHETAGFSREDDGRITAPASL